MIKARVSIENKDAFSLIRRCVGTVFSIISLLYSISLQAAAPSVQGITSGGIPAGPSWGSPANNGPLKASSSSASGSALFQRYALVDAKHFTTDFYDEEGKRVKRDASVRTSLRVGFRLLGGVVDASGGVGAAKLTSEPRIYHNRSDALLQIYPAQGQIFDFLLYVNALFPVRVQDLDPTEYMEGGLFDEDLRRAVDATIIFAGMSPKMKLDFPTPAGGFRYFLTLDARVMTYSKALVGEAPSKGPPILEMDESSASYSSTTPELVDWAPRYANQVMSGISYAPGFLPGLAIEYAGSYESRFVPEYFYNRCSKSWNYTYAAERVSFTRFALRARLTHEVSLSAETYFLRNGFFQVDRVNNQSRFKNIVTVTVNF